MKFSDISNTRKNLLRCIVILLDEREWEYQRVYDDELCFIYRNREVVTRWMLINELSALILEIMSGL